MKVYLKTIEELLKPSKNGLFEMKEQEGHIRFKTFNYRLVTVKQYEELLLQQPLDVDLIGYGSFQANLTSPKMGTILFSPLLIKRIVLELGDDVRIPKLEDTLSQKTLAILTNTQLFTFETSDVKGIFFADQAIADPTKISFFTKLEHALIYRWLKGNLSDYFVKLYREKMAVMTRPGRFYAKFGIKDPQELEEITSHFVDFTFDIVEGEDIRKYYLLQNYVPYEKTSLQRSCMRWESCSEWMDVYVDNLKMVISRDINDQIYGRALLWENVRDLTNNQTITFLDRIYGSDIFIHSMKKYAKSQGWVHKTYQSYTDPTGVTFPDGSEEDINMKVTFPRCTYEYHPYMDTMFHSDDVGTYANHFFPESVRQLQDTEGNNDAQTCESCGLRISNDDVQTGPDGSCYCHECFHEVCAVCTNCYDTIWVDDAFSANDENLCDRCFTELYTTCDSCNEVVAIDDAIYYDNENYCPDCAQEAEVPCATCGVVHPLRTLLEDTDEKCPTCHNDEADTEITPIQDESEPDTRSHSKATA
jgi:hypothetical protein